ARILLSLVALVPSPRNGLLTSGSLRRGCAICRRRFTFSCYVRAESFSCRTLLRFRRLHQFHTIAIEIVELGHVLTISELVVLDLAKSVGGRLGREHRCNRRNI